MGALAALPAFAAGAEPTVDETVPLPFVGEAVVVGQRPRNRVARDPTGAATVIDAAEFAGEAKGVAELVSTAPGVAVDGYGGLGQMATASIRGSTASGVLVLLDGIPLKSAFGSGVDLASIPRSWIDRIEIVRGAEGAHYGPGSLGGVVNVVTSRPRSGSWSAEATGGSFGSFSAAADVARAIGLGTVLLSAGGERTDGAFPYLFQPTQSFPGPPTRETRPNNAAWRGGAMAKGSAPLGTTSVDAVALISAGRRELPGSPYKETPTDWQEDGRAILAARVATPGPGSGLQLAGQLSTRYEWLGARYGSADVDQRFGAVGLGLEAKLHHPGGLLRLETTAQGEGARADGLAGTITRASFSASASEELLVAGDRLRLAPAVRIERDGGFDGLSAKAGASWRLMGPVALRASTGRTFRAPSVSELRLQQGLVMPNPDLLPEVGLGGDAALVLDGGAIIASLGGHATLYRDLIYYQQINFGRLRPLNAGKALFRGLELELATVPLLRPLGLAISASYTLLETEILRGDEKTLGNEVPHRARHRLYARVAAAPGPIEAHVELHYVGRQWNDDTNDQEIPAALVWNAGGSVRLARAPAIRLALELRNLLDDRTLQDGYGNPLPGRTALVTVSAGTPKAKGTP